ncbi:transposase [Streptomyces sp. TE12347]
MRSSTSAGHWKCGTATGSLSPRLPVPTGRPSSRSLQIIGSLVWCVADAQWARIEPLLPERTPKRGGRWRDHRQVIDAIAFKYRTGTPWMDLPEHFGS